MPYISWNVCLKPTGRFEGPFLGAASSDVSVRKQLKAETESQAINCWSCCVTFTFCFPSHRVTIGRSGTYANGVGNSPDWGQKRSLVAQRTAEVFHRRKPPKRQRNNLSSTQMVSSVELWCRDTGSHPLEYFRSLHSFYMCWVFKCVFSGFFGTPKKDHSTKCDL